MSKLDFSLDVIDLRGKADTDLIERLNSRAKMDLPEVNEAVKKIIDAVRQEGDQAVLNYTERFDHVSFRAEDLRVPQADIDEAVRTIDPDLLMSLKSAAANIRRFHEAQMEVERDVRLDDGAGRRSALITRALDTAGIYVPGGTAPLPSSVLMNAIPAKAAGVRRLVMCTPPTADGSVAAVILAAASIAGADEIYRVGGAQAIAAMAFGTESIPQVDKIVGPGNIYVNTAKRFVYGTVDIDMFAGPSEILILADLGADPNFIAADMLSQAEHDPLASAMVVVTDYEQALAVRDCALARAKQHTRRDILRKSLADYGAVIVVDDSSRQVALSNQIAPEHLELCMAEENALRLLPEIKNAGAIFVGYYSPEPLGDYWAGANHVLPTSGTSRFFSPLNCSDFLKKISVIHYSREALLADGRQIVSLANAEGLDCHAEAITVRMTQETASASNDRGMENE